MKNFVLYLCVAIAIVALNSEATAKIVAVQEYSWDMSNIGPVSNPGRDAGDGSSVICPMEYPLTLEEKQEAVSSGDNVSCSESPDVRGCFKCSAPCENTSVYPFTESDCAPLRPDNSGACTPIEGEKRYKSCLCPDGWFKDAQLSEVPAVSGFSSNFSFYKEQTKTATGANNRKVSCYKPKGCASGKNTVTASDFDMTDIYGDHGKAQNKQNKCTRLFIKSLLKNTTGTGNYWCATGYECINGCKKELETGHCEKTAEDQGLKNWYDNQTYCKYYTGCETNNGACVTGSSSSHPAVLVSSRDIQYYTPSEKSFKTKKCYKTTGCNNDITIMYMHGAGNLQGNIAESILKEPDAYGNQTCGIYTCNQQEGWIYAASSSTGNINFGTPSQDGLFYDSGVAYNFGYVQNGSNIYACKKPANENETCSLVFDGLFDGRLSVGSSGSGYEKLSNFGGGNAWAGQNFHLGEWYIPSIGEWMDFYGTTWTSVTAGEGNSGSIAWTSSNMYKINQALENYNNLYIPAEYQNKMQLIEASQEFWSSTEALDDSNGNTKLWAYKPGSSSRGYRERLDRATSTAYIRPVLFLQNVVKGDKPEVGELFFSDYTHGTTDNTGGQKVLVGIVAWVSPSGKSVKIMALQNVNSSLVGMTGYSAGPNVVSPYSPSQLTSRVQSIGNNYATETCSGQ